MTSTGPDGPADLPDGASRAGRRGCHQDQLTADLTSGGRAAHPEPLADQLSVIMAGTYAWAQALSAAGPARHARAVAESLLDVS